MCGRSRCTLAPEQVAAASGVPADQLLEQGGRWINRGRYKPSYNVQVRGSVCACMLGRSLHARACGAIAWVGERWSAAAPCSSAAHPPCTDRQLNLERHGVLPSTSAHHASPFATQPGFWTPVVRLADDGSGQRVVETMK